MAGVIVGLEFAEAMATARALGAVADDITTECLMSIEIGALAGVAKSQPTNR